MSRVPLEFVLSSVGAYLFDGLPEELGNVVTSEVKFLALSYQQDELWLNLEERTMPQIRVHLFENSVIKGRR
jgi:hypothetical protein